MASSTASNVTNTIHNVQESIDLVASTFVRQYYTMLNKAPHLIHNFYSHHSTFIYGTIEMANDQPTQPIVGREKIRQKMEDLKLNDCRAKIERIDCLKTLADGLVIQVIGELSNNGKAMKRFLQTFVLAPGLDSRQDGDGQQQRPNHDRRGPHSNDNVNAAPKSKFFVLNSIFRYQVDGADSDSDIDATSMNSPLSNVNDDQVAKRPAQIQETSESGHVDSTTATNEGNQESEATGSKKLDSEVQRLAEELDESVRLSKQQASIEDTNKRDIGSGKIVNSNGTSDSTDKKIGNELSEKSTENGKSVIDRSHATNTVAQAGSFKLQPLSANNMNRTQHPAEPKTWANMVRNTPSATATTNTTLQQIAPKADPQQVANQSTTSVHNHQHHYHSTQTQTQPQPPPPQQHQSPPQNPQQQQSQHPNQQQQPMHQQQLQNQQQPQAQQFNPQQPQPTQAPATTTPHLHQAQNMHANRRRNMLRKGPSNKTTGRPLNKSHRPRLPTTMGSNPPSSMTITLTPTLPLSAVPTAAPQSTTTNTTTTTSTQPQPQNAGARPFV